MERDKLSLDIFWLRDESLEDGDRLPPPDILAAEIVGDLQVVLTEFTELALSLAPPNSVDMTEPVRVANPEP